MKIKLSIVLLLGSLCLYAQDSFRVQLSDNSLLQLTGLEVTTQITGNFAQTQYHMTFYNGLNQIMEGELQFPLAQGQSVSGLAMDVNGKMRDAVIVEKEQARTAYESTIRQKIDPALLEKTQGNNYKLRVYPIPARGYKEIILIYEETLTSTENAFSYTLPLGIQETLAHFNVQITIAGAEKLPLVTTAPFGNKKFKTQKAGYSLHINKKEFAPQEALTIQFQQASNNHSILTYEDVFYAFPSLTLKTKQKAAAQNIDLVWDASLSQLGRDITSELAVLEGYLKSLSGAEVRLITLRNTAEITKSFVLNTKEDRMRLLETLKKIDYDGGSSWKSLENIRSKADEVLMFSDGMVNLGNYSKTFTQPWYLINSQTSANHEYLQQIAQESGGKYFNLQQQPIASVVKGLQTQTYRFLGLANAKTTDEIYPKPGSPVTHGFIVAGNMADCETISLLFGYGTQVTDTLLLEVPEMKNNDLVVRRWAQLKLNDLNTRKKENKDAIISLAKAHHLVTDYTSLLILDRLEDYLRFEIEPPKELLADYRKRRKEQKQRLADAQEDLEIRKEEMQDSYEELLDWYEENWKLQKAVKKVTPTQTQTASTNTTPTEETTPTNRTLPQNTTTRVTNGTEKTITGVISDENGLPLPGVNVIVKGTTNGTQTNFDGQYSIAVGRDDVLVFSYISYNSTMRAVPVDQSLSFRMTPDNTELQEVVVVGYGRPKSAKAVGYAVTTVESESLENMPELDVVRSLNGKVAGVQIAGTSGAKGSGSQFVIRSKSSINGNNQPLYVIDGVPYTENSEAGFSGGNTQSSNSFLDIETDKIVSVQVLDGLSASTLYGQQGNNGVVFITTKEGVANHQEIISNVEEKLEEATTIKAWDPTTPYLSILQEQPTLAASYRKYLEIRYEYFNQPSFYLDVSRFFYEKDPALGIQILTNLVEIKINDQELLKALAYQLEAYDQPELAVAVYETLVEAFPEHPQNYRDLALAYQQVNAYQKSFDLLYTMYRGDFLEKDVDERFVGMEQLVFVELCHLVHQHKKQLSITSAQQKEFPNLEMDVRVVIDWNHDLTDLDLWVDEPSNEKVSYKNTLSDIGGYLTEDLTEGFGPESYMLRKGIKGDYEITVDYYGDDQQKIAGPTILKTTIYKNYGRNNETREVLIKRLYDDADEILIQKIAL